MRKRFIAGNWKMNLDRKGAVELASTLRERCGSRTDLDVAVFPPFVYVPDVARALAGSAIRVGGQNCCDEPSGAFTGEVSAAMLADVGATMVILGHSERRHVYGETDELVQKKVRLALAAGLDVILCVGETLAERRASATEKVIGAQLKRGLDGLQTRELSKITIAYEPVWAIGTGQNATPEQASQAHGYLRGLLASLHDEGAASRVRIQYGGSVKPENVRAIVTAPEVDGCLVGGASIKAETFLPLLIP
jgi:triosephosphate isomerase